MSKPNKLPKGVELTHLKDNFDVAHTEYSQAFMRAKKLDMVDKNKLWKAVSAQYPSYQILPETNHVSYIKNNILASIYTVGKCASILPTSEQDREIVMQLNIALEQIWSQLDVPYYQMLAGERAALLNLGVTQVGWDNNVVSGKDKTFEKGRCVLKNVNPLHYMRDPFAPTLDEASFVITWEEYHKSVLLANENYKESFKEYLEKHKGGTEGTVTIQPDTDRVSKDVNGKKDYYKLFTHWVRVADKIHEIHTINNEYVLYVREDIKPSTFPFAELFCNLPDESLLGVSEPNKILANSLAYNIMQSIMLTADYKNQRPPKFINSASGLNINSFKKHGNEADYTFVVSGDASRAVHYHQFPAPSATAPTNMAMLTNDIKNVTGVDDRYTGRDTGSILTTGGVNSMLDQVTMIDAPKVLNYEHYCKKLTQLILYNYINFSAIARNYFVRDKRNPKKWNGVTVDFPKIDNATVFDYEINISSELPKNKTVVANMANKMMEMQMQYSAQNIEVDLITPQEWLMLQQDLPIKEYMLERMGLQRTSNWVEATAQIVTQYTSLIEQGVNPSEALNTTAATMEAQSSPNGGVENVMQNIQNGVPY
jgi:hypothetical protein